MLSPSTSSGRTIRFTDLRHHLRIGSLRLLLRSRLDTSQVFDRIVSRVIRAAKLDVELYEEVQADETLTPQAVAVVIIAALAAAISGAVTALVWFGVGPAFFQNLIVLPILTLASYFLWAYLAYFLGRRLFKAEATVGEVIRTLGYAHGPRVLILGAILDIIPGAGLVVVLFVLGGTVWSFLTSFIAIQQALDLSNVKTAFLVAIGLVIYQILPVILAVIPLVFGIS